MTFDHNTLSNSYNWKLPEGICRIRTIDAHTEGEPLRIIVAGYPPLQGETVLERRLYALEHQDHLRKALMWEPRGHADMYGCLILPPVTQDAHFSVLFLHNEGYSSMCGHGIIAVTRVALETGILPFSGSETTVIIDTPAGQIRAVAHVEKGQIHSVSFRNVPAFVQALDREVRVPGLGSVRYDLAYGGAFYAYVRAQDLGLSLTPEHYRELISKGMAIKRAVMASEKMDHPFEPDLNFLYGTIFTGPALSADANSRNVCIFAEGEVDRSPTGTGVSGRMALHHLRGELALGESMIIESILGTRFTAEVAETCQFGRYPAVVPRVTGRAWITGRHEFLLDPSDPLKQGFFLR